MLHVGSCRKCEWIISRPLPWELPEKCPKCKYGNLVYITCDHIDKELAEGYLAKPLPQVEYAIAHPTPNKPPRKAKA